jgi:hypothetical protein
MRMAKTPVVLHTAVPAGARWDIGGVSVEEKRDLERKVRRGEMIKVRASWCGISPLKMVYFKSEAKSQNAKMELVSSHSDSNH